MFDSLIIKIVGFIAIVYLTLTLILFLAQRKILYYPNANFPTEDLVKAKGLEYWITPDKNYRGLISQEPENNYKGTIIVFHGNASLAIDRSYYNDTLVKLGYRVLLAEYPGYGGREGKPSEFVLVADARETIKLVHQEYGSPIYVWGESLGAGVVAAAVSDTTLPVEGIILITPWDSLSNLAQTTYSYFPVRWIVLDKFNTVKNLQEFKGNIAILIAGKDKIVPAQLGNNLYESLPNNNKKLWFLENAGHNSWLDYLDNSWWQELMNFLTTVDE